MVIFYSALEQKYSMFFAATSIIHLLIDMHLHKYDIMVTVNGSIRHNYCNTSHQHLSHPDKCHASLEYLVQNEIHSSSGCAFTEKSKSLSVHPISVPFLFPQEMGRMLDEVTS